MATRTVGGGSGEGGGVGHGSGGVVSLHLFAGIKKSGRSVLPAHFLALLSLSRKSASALLSSTFHRYITVVLYSTVHPVTVRTVVTHARRSFYGRSIAAWVVRARAVDCSLLTSDC